MNNRTYIRAGGGGTPYLKSRERRTGTELVLHRISERGFEMV